MSNESKIENRSEEEVAGYSRITCPCGFEVVGQDEGHNVEAFDLHECPHGGEVVGDRWYHAVFSVWGAIIAIALGVAAVDIAKALIR